MARSKTKRSRKQQEPHDEGGLFARRRASGSATAERLKEIGGLALFGFAFWLGLSLVSWRSNPAAGDGWN